MTATQIVVGERGEARHEELAGVAAGFTPDGSLQIILAGMDQLGLQQRWRLADELEGLVAVILRGQVTPIQ